MQNINKNYFFLTFYLILVININCMVHIIDHYGKAILQFALKFTLENVKHTFDYRVKYENNIGAYAL